MSTVAGLFFVNNSPGGKDLPSADCSMTDLENNQTLSEDDNTSCSNSEMSSEISTHPHLINPATPTDLRANVSHRRSGNGEVDLSSDNHNSSGSSRRNKRKNFMPRNITEYAGSDEDEEHQRRAVGNNNLAVNRHEAKMNLSMPRSPDDEETDDDEEQTDLRIRSTHSPDTPLDLSEVQNDSKRLWQKPDFMNASAPTSFQWHTPNSHGRPGHLPFHPMDLSRIAGDPYDEDRSNDLLISSTSSNSNNSLQNGHGTRTTPTAAALTDFAESTMKELLGLYGIAQIQAGGKPGPTDIPSLHRQLTSGSDSTSGQHNNKMMLPENMVRLLAAMQESVNAANNNVVSTNNNCHNSTSSSGTNSPSRNHHNSSPSQNSGSMVQQSQVTPGSGGSGISVLKSQLHSNNNNNHGEGTEHHHGNGSHNNNHNHHSHGHNSILHQQSKGLRNSKHSNSAKNSSSGRGLTAFPVIREGLLGKGSGPVDYTRYVKRYGSSAECGYQHCRDLNYREHFHCLDCGQGARVFVKKEEMIRHFKWHKKRDESLQHGFMRYSPSDDCSDRFVNCTHNRKQTHYHCLHDPCEKVYISTSDVQMHANYHRKDSAIIQEGFQRFRAAEDCATDHCTFRHQRTTHFHCRRSTCSYTFKNKADMEKHKSYHIKDEQLNRDGFKKFMKHETCQYPSCRFSRVCNHIHCIRDGCNYVLHSSGQLYSHKRKHERRDSELAYRKFKLAQSVMRGTFGAELSSLSESFMGRLDDDNSHSSINEPIDIDSDEAVKKFVHPCTCDITPEDHYHCRAESCVNALLGNAEVASEHSRSHEVEDRISSLAYFTVDPANFDAQDSTIPCVSAKCAYQHREKHYHCLWDACSEVILATDEPFKRLEHFKEHETSQKLEFAGIEKPTSESLDGFFKRKRGRPPKNRTIEVSSGANEAIFTSFKLPKPIFPGLHLDNDNSDSDMKDPIGFLSYAEGTPCPDTSCSFNTSAATAHYHCGHPRCHFSVEDVHKLSLHLRDFHSNVDILDGYEYYDRNSDCRDSTCEFNGSASHFHCLRDGYIFSRYSSMTTHEADCHDSKSTNDSSDEEEKPWNGQVKSRGTFYPMPPGNEKRNNNENNPMDLSSPNGDSSDAKPITDHSLSRILAIPSESSETQFGPDSACGRPFCKLKRKQHYHCHLCNQAFSDLDKLRPHVSKHSSLTAPKNAPDSNTDSDEERHESDHDHEHDLKLFTTTKIKMEDQPHNLRSRNIPIPVSPSMIPDISGVSTPSTSFTPTSLSSFLGYPATHSPYMFLQQNPLTSLYAGMMFGGGGATPYPGPGVLSPPPASAAQLLQGAAEPCSSSLSPLQQPQSVLKRPPSNSSIPSPPPDSKKQRLQIRILKDEPVPDGYVRFRFNEDCAYLHCGYREHQTHFHCTREDCGYSFCDKTRFVQHTARHERLDTLMGGDFKQFRASVPCGRLHCSYTPSPGTIPSGQQNKASHFHCCKCEFVCTDTNKVVAHRRQHQKLDSIMAAGFEKFTPSQHCQIDSCIHAQKQTHYHCLKCSYAVLGLSQMSAHKFRHAD